MTPRTSFQKAPFASSATQGHAQLLEGIFLAELERVDGDAEGEDRIVEPARAGRRPGRFVEAALDDVPDERLVEEGEEDGGEDEEDDDAENKARYPERSPQRFLHGPVGQL